MAAHTKNKEAFVAAIRKLKGEIANHIDKKSIKEEANNNVCKEVINYLNQKGKKGYKLIEGNLKFARGRLKDYSVEDIKKVIEFMAQRVSKGDFDSKYFRPETILNATKFESYYNDYLDSVKSTPKAESKPNFSLLHRRAANLPNN